MKKLVSKKEIERKRKRNNYILGIVLVIVMFGSVFGVIVNSFGNQEEIEKITYNGYEFLKQNNYYILSLGDYEFYFTEDPNEISILEKEINMTKTLPQLVGSPLYISSIDSSSSREIYQNLDLYVERIQFACLENETCLEDNLPIKTCEDNLIVIKEAEENKIYEENNCVFIEGKKEDLVKLTDEFIFNLLGLNQ